MSGQENGKTLPLVSVIIPAHNSAAYIVAAVDSVLDQDYPSREVIVIDDGSTDATPDVLAAYGERIHLIRQDNAGSAVARNRGLEAARGDYIAFLDGDDVWLPGKLTAQVAYMEQNTEVDMTYGRWRQWHPAADGRFDDQALAAPPREAGLDAPPGIVPERSGWVYHLLLTEFIVWTSVVMARRRLVERVGGFDARYRRGQDFDYWLRASRLTEIHMLDRPMALYRQHEENSTHACPPRNYAAEIIDRSLARWGPVGPDGSRPDMGALRRHRARLWAGYASKQLRAGLARKAIVSFARAARIRPLVPRVWLLMGVSALTALGLYRMERTLEERG